MTLHKYDIVNELGRDFNLSSFLEISSESTGFCFDKVDEALFTVKDILCYFPEAVPDNFLSVVRADVDEEIQFYESQLCKIREKNRKYDLVFVDPWHTYEQSMRDLETALQFVSANGFIVAHDCCPYSAHLIGPYKPGEWCGQTYEAFVDFRYAHPDLDVLCVNDDYGCGVISMSPRFFVEKPSFGYDQEKIRHWEYFNTHKKQLLHLVEVKQFQHIRRVAKHLERVQSPFLKKMLRWFLG